MTSFLKRADAHLKQGALDPPGIRGAYSGGQIEVIVGPMGLAQAAGLGATLCV